MEKMKSVPIFRRFGFKVLLFNAVLLFCIIAPSITLNKNNYKILVDKLNIHADLFWYCVDELSRAESDEWPETIRKFPKILPQQRICIFTPDRELYYDSGIMKEYGQWEKLGLLFPSPYIDWKKDQDDFNPQVLVDHLLAIDTDDLNPFKKYSEMRNVGYPQGMDRIILSGIMILADDGEELVFTLTNSVTDLLINERALKERFLLIYSAVIIMGLLLSILLSRSVTSPLRKLYRYSQDILVSRWNEKTAERLPERGEIGEICGTLQGLIVTQKRQAENFRRFSSDIVHELKTPLSAIRSGLELYAESASEDEKPEIYSRINRRISQMEKLMNEIQFIGNIESADREEKCNDIEKAVRESLHEFSGSSVDLQISPGIGRYMIYISSEKLLQIIQNLVKNAVSFSPQKGSVSVSVSVAGKNLVIMVSDRGPGIREEVMESIASRFFSYRPDSEERHSGLGLSIADAILRTAGGSLGWENRKEGGALFVCRIPVYGN